MARKTLKMGLIQVYTGDGKGKTTAALGQALRSVGAGYRVYMVQFLKGGKTGELEAARRLEPDFKIFRFEKERGFSGRWTNSRRRNSGRKLRKPLNLLPAWCGSRAVIS